MKISVVSYRGGSGKSMLCLNLANHFFEDSILIEADFLAPSLHYILSEHNSSSDIYFWNDFLTGTKLLKENITTFRGIQLIPTRPNDDEIISQLHNKNLWSHQFSDRIIQFMTDVEKNYKYVIIDNQGGLFLSTIVHSFFADLLILVVRPDIYDVRSSVEYIQNFKKEFYVVWNQVLNHQNMESQIDIWEHQYFESMKHYKGSLARIPFDQESAYLRWVEGKALIFNTTYSDKIEEIGSKLEKLRMSST